MMESLPWLPATEAEAEDDHHDETAHEWEPDWCSDELAGEDALRAAGSLLFLDGRRARGLVAWAEEETRGG